VIAIYNIIHLQHMRTTLDVYVKKPALCSCWSRHRETDLLLQTARMLLGACYSPEHTDPLPAAMKHHQLPTTSSTSRTSATSSTSSSPASTTSLFTIDSILAPRPSHQPPLQQHLLSPPAVLHHPLHIGHLAAAAASGFGATSADFLGKRWALLEKMPDFQLVK